MIHVALMSLNFNVKNLSFCYQCLSNTLQYENCFISRNLNQSGLYQVQNYSQNYHFHFTYLIWFHLVISFDFVNNFSQIQIHYLFVNLLIYFRCFIHCYWCFMSSLHTNFDSNFSFCCLVLALGSFTLDLHNWFHRWLLISPWLVYFGELRWV